MHTMDRREFLKCASIALAGLAFPRLPILLPPGQPLSRVSSASLGRIATWWRQPVRRLALQSAEVVAWKSHDEVIPLYAAVVGQAPWPKNPIWYRTDRGYIHSGYVQPVENTPSDEVVAHVSAPGFWAQVCVPIAEARWRPDSAYLYRKLYYGTVYRVVNAMEDDDGNWWYQLREGVTWSPGPYVPAWSVRRIPPGELSPISPARCDKWIEINLNDQRLTCFEGETAVFAAPISSGSTGRTPRGEYRVLSKRHTSRMTGGDEEDHYDLPGVAFPVYFTGSGIASHGTYWHNDFVRPHSHGCVNMTNQDAQWVFRWTDPVLPYDRYSLTARREEATRIIVV